MRKRLMIYCEGQTEEFLVSRLIRNHLSHHGVCVERPVSAATTRRPDGGRGGFVNWDAIRFDLTTQFAGDPDPNLRFTTLFDTYAMPKRVLALAGFTGPITTPPDIETVEQAIERDLAEPRFKAYLQRHEIEALVLADLDALGRVFHRDDAGVAALRAEIANFSNPEDINHGPATHPSARLATKIPSYGALKASHAFWVLAEAGLEKVRARCKRFNKWIEHWENWGAQP
jgi:hypothetical protein